jgi:hypothetical protein
MEYVDVSWFHEFREEPIRLVSELDEQRYEVRKIEFFRDGSVGVASLLKATRGTQLGCERMPSLAQINSDPQFSGSPIDVESFEALWKKFAEP